MISIKFQHSNANWLKLSSSVYSFERLYISLEKVFGMSGNNIPLTIYELQTISSEPIGIFYIPLNATRLHLPPPPLQPPSTYTQSTTHATHNDN